ncbi:MAG: S16 family serine protease [Thermoprotei archaeon]
MVMVRKIVFLVILLMLLTGFTVSTGIVDGYSLENSAWSSSPNSLFNYVFTKTITLQAPAVTSSGSGILTNITVGIGYPGSGRVFFSALPFTELDTQAAARTAAWVAASIAGIEFYKYDYFVVVESKSPIIGGPSAGALMTIGFLSLFLNTTINESVTMTGMINPDGTIGPVGGLKEKLEAAAENGYRTFLIPLGQRIYRYPVVVEERYFFVVIRRVEYRTVDLVELGRELGVSVIEVSNVVEAFKYFTNKTIQAIGVEEAINWEFQTKTIKPLVDELFSNTTDLLAETRELAGKVRDPFQRYWLERSLGNLENKLNITRELISSGYYYYSVPVLLSIYGDLLYTYWYAGVVSGVLSIDDILREYSGVIAGASESISNTSVEPYYSVVIPYSMALAKAKLAENLYARAVTAHRSGDDAKALEYASLAVSQALGSKILLAIAMNSSGGSLVDEDLVLLAYSNALSTYSYGLALISEVTGSTDALSSSSMYYEVLSNTTMNNYSVILGASIYVSAYTCQAIHKALDQAPTDKLVESLWRLIGVYAARTDISSLPIAWYYLGIAVEAIENSDYESALPALVIALTILQYSGITKGNPVTINTTVPITTPSQAPGSTTNKSISITNSTTTSGIASGFTSLEAWALVILATIILVLGVFLYLLAHRSVSRELGV